jgi:outer membrane protein assembly factor BamB
MSVRKSMVRFVVAVVVVVSAACGTTDRTASDDPDELITDTTVPMVPPSMQSSDEPSGGPVCEDDLVPALAALDPATGEFQWTYCSADLAWREVRGATDDVVYVNSTMSDSPSTAVASDQRFAVTAVDALSGEELWRVPVARQQLGWPLGPFAGSGVVVVAVDDDNGAAIVGLDAKSGDTIWRVAEADLSDAAASMGTPDPVVAPLANTDEVAVLAAPSGLVGLDRVNGTQLWSSEVFLLDESGVGVARGPAAVDGSTVMIPAASQIATAPMPPGGESGTGCCVAPDGATYCVGEPGETSPGAVIAGDDDPPCELVTAPLGPSTLVAVDASTGATLWQGPRLDHPAAADGYVVGYVHAGMGSSGPNSEVVVVDAATGEQLWSQPGSESYGDLWAIGDGAVYVNVISDDSLPSVVAYELESGDERWRLSPESMLSEPQQVVNDGVALLWNDLAMLSTTDGTTRWTIPATVSPETPMSSVGHNPASMFVSFNGLQWTD